MQNVGAEQMLQLTSRTLMGSPVAGLDRAYVERWLSRHRTALLTVIQAELTRHEALLPPAAPPEHFHEEAACHDVPRTSPQQRAVMLWDMRHRVGLYVVACGAAKASEPCAAADLYTSGYFRDNLAAARALAGSDEMVRILSGRHGLVRLDERLEPYDLRVGEEGTIGIERLARQLEATGSRGAVLVFGGREYADLLDQAVGSTRTIVRAYADIPGGLPAQRAVARAVMALVDRAPGRAGPRQVSGVEEPAQMLLEKCAIHGAGCMTDAELLGLVLSGGNARQAARAEATAHRLLEQLGSLGPILEMSMPELEAAGNFGNGGAALLTATGELARRMTQPRAAARLQIRSAQDVFDAYHAHLSPLSQEVFIVILLDVRNRRISDVTVARGSLTEAVVHPREVFLPAIRASAAGILVLHNHPSGDPEPSAADLELTRRLVGAGKVLGIKVVDHVIVGRGRFVSLGERVMIGD